MNKTVFPYIAMGLGLTMLAILLAATALTTDDKQVLPLLTLLIISEFGFIVTGIGAAVGMMAISASPRKFMMTLTALACAAMSVRFMMLGIEFWPL